MTKARYDNHSTEFGLWLREQPEIDSSLGFVTTNLDYIWDNYKTDKFMLLEEKRYKGTVKFYQEKLFKRIDKLCQADPLYCGFHKLVFENTNPDDGKMWLDEKLITRDEVIQFLQFRR